MNDLSILSFLGGFLCLAVDTWFYERITFTPLNFLRTNVLHGVALFYGSHAWYFYLIAATPMLLGALLPFAAHGAYLVVKARECKAAVDLVSIAAGVMAIYSAMGHKEWRFIQQLLPILHCIAAHSLRQLSASSPVFADYAKSWRPSIKRSYIYLILLINIPGAFYFLQHHQRAQVSISNYVRNMPDGQLRSLGFLMECHMVPWQSHMHRAELETPGRRSGYGGKLWGLTCDPPTQ